MKTEAWLLLAAGLSLAACGGDVQLESGSAGVSDSTGGDGNYANLSCGDLEAEYDNTFQKARICSPELTVAQCSRMIDSSLACSCPSFVNASNVQLVAKLDALRAEWDSRSCPGSDCLVKCAAPTGAICALTAPSSMAAPLCEDQR